ncbi:MAG: TAT-variant-translocated molybdopterin oxidoreductase [Acidobacteriota bacterium]
MNKDGAAKTEKKYWRSLERLLDSPAFPGQREDEFPEGASYPPDGISRRSWFRLMGASMALAGLATCRRPEEAIVPYVNAPENVIPGIPRQYATTMPWGTSAYGLLVESHEGRPTKIEGNPLHPSSRGAANSWMQASILGLYDPDRLRNVNSLAQAGQAAEATWQDFADFWNQSSQELEASGGQGLAVIAEAYSSPTMARLVARFRQRFPNARWVTYEPAGDDNIYEGLRRAAGQAYRPVYHLERTSTILALDSDFLLTESENIANTRGFAAGRKVDGESDGMSRLYVVESSLSLTGANADHRLRLQSRSIPILLAALAQRLGVNLEGGLAQAAAALPDPELQGKLDLIADDLASSGGRSVLLAGRRQPPQVHALVFALNQALGAIGETVTLHELRDAEWGNTSDLASLAVEMGQGSISTLVVLGANPVYTAPVDLDFATVLEKVPNRIHLGSHLDETSEMAQWRLPQSHFLESWGDARAADGTLSVIQPLIAPLFDSRSSVELLAVLNGNPESNGYDLVRQTWQEGLLSGEDFESRWRKVLHDGVLEDSALPPVSAAFGAGPAGAEPIVQTDGLEVDFHLSPSLYDGRFANNGWLQELPDPVTKLTWDNAALVSPTTAEALEVKSGDIISLTCRGRKIEAPVWIHPGQADGSISLALGYGRSSAGVVGSGVGFDAYQLRHSEVPYFDGSLQVEKTGNHYDFSQTQEHWSVEGRPLVREASLDEYRSRPGFASEPDAELHGESLWDEREYTEGYQWGMAIDLGGCVGCNACVVACQSENNIPIVGKEQVRNGREMQWLRVDRYYSGDIENPQAVFQPVPCMQCENAPCEQVCPVAATVHDREGINAMVYNRCIGTRYCSNNCPYKVRRFNFFNYTKDTPELVQMAMNPDVTVRSRGVMEKCTYCIQRINESKIAARRENRLVEDGEIKTACQQTCPTNAIVFGNINDLNSEVSKVKKNNRNYVLLPELHNRPRTSYLAKIRNPNPKWGDVV